MLGNFMRPLASVIVSITLASFPPAKASSDLAPPPPLLTRPAAGVPKAAVVFVPGSGCLELAKYFRNFAELLPPDFAVFGARKRFESANVEQCSKEFSAWEKISRRAEDLRVQLGEISRTTACSVPIVLWGSSEGASVAVVEAANDPRIAAVYNTGTGGTSVDEMLLNSKALEKFTMTASEMKGRLADVRARPDAVDEFLLGHAFAYWSDWMNLDLLGAYKKLSVPVVAGHGTLDDSSPIEGMRAMQHQLQLAGKKNFKLIEYPGADHSLKTADHRYGLDFIATMVDEIRSLRSSPEACLHD